MRKIMICILLLGLCVRLTAPSFTTLYIEKAEPINPYKNIKHAIGMVEVLTNGKLDTTAINYTEGAYGFFQIRQVRLNDYYKKTGVRYSLNDMLDYDKAEKVFMYYAIKIGYRNPSLIIRNWNGSGKQTYVYLKKVNKYL